MYNSGNAEYKLLNRRYIFEDVPLTLLAQKKPCEVVM